MTDETEYPKSAGSHSSKMTGWTVEARYNYSEPTEIGGQLFDNRWRRVRFNESVIGVPIAAEYNARIYAEHNVLGYPAAQALRWWFHAVATAEKTGGGLCIETKLVKHVIETSSKCEAVSEHDIIGGDDRSNIMPDWGSEG